MGVMASSHYLSMGQSRLTWDPDDDYLDCIIKEGRPRHCELYQYLVGIFHYVSGQRELVSGKHICPPFSCLWM